MPILALEALITKMRLISKAVTTFCILAVTGLAAGASLPEFSYHLSNRRINAIAQAPDGFLWFGTAHGLNRYSGENFLTWYASDQPGDLNNDLIYDICFDAEGVMWLATECGIIHYEDGGFVNRNKAVSNPVHRVIPLPDSTVIASGRDGLLKMSRETEVLGRYFIPGISWAKNIVVDSLGHLWVVEEIGDSVEVIVLDSMLNLLKSFTLGRGMDISCIDAGRTGVWVAAGSTVLRFDPQTMSATGGSAALSRLASGSECVFIKEFDSSRILVGIRGKGMFLHSVADGSDVRINPEEDLEGDAFKVLVDRDRNIWFCEEGGDFKVFPDRRDCVNHSGFLDEAGASLVRNMESDSRGRIWMSLEDGYAGYDPKSRELIWRERERAQFTSVFVDSRDRLWTISNLYNVKRWSLNGDTPVLERTFSFKSNVSSVSEDAEGRIWIINNFCFHMIDRNDNIREIGAIETGSGKVAHTMAIRDATSGRVFVNTVRDGLYECFPDREFIPVTLGGGVSGINSLVTSGDGTMWMGSFNQGLIHFNPASGDIRRFNLSTGLSSNSIESLLIDGRGRIWFNTPTHVICYDPEKDIFNTVYDRSFSETDFYSLRCAVKTPDGKLFFGGYGGLTEIDEDIEFDDRNPEIPMHFEYISINGVQLPEIGKKVEMNWREKLLTVMFSGLNFNFGTLLNYSYMLEGFDRDWTYTDKIQVNYSNLPPGKYNLRVRVRYMNGKWSSNELNMPLIVHPAPWASNGAKIAYVLILAGAAFLLVNIYLKYRMRRRELAFKQEHLDFITNVSHELRTPLSLIVGPLSQLRKSPGLSDKDRRYIDTMERNAERLKIISEELMDSPSSRRKDESLLVAETDISSLVAGIANNFRFAAMEKSLQLETDIAGGVSGFTDSLKLEKILVNLISNACKYTPESGTVRIVLRSDGGNAVFEIKDNGIGIPEEKRGQIFDRFERLDVEKKEPAAGGSGIGLNYAQSLAKLHKGKLSYRPASSGQGSVFTLTIPISRDAYDECEISDTPRISKYPSLAGEIKERKFIPGQPNVLVAEDNPEISSFLADILSDEYNVIVAPDGLEAWENLKIAIPDIVVSDVVMPQKDGYTLCNDIKSNSEYCHVPVILLTAKNDKESTIRGLGKGADAYIGKPFDPDFLKATVRSLIENRKRIQQRVLNLTQETIKDEKLVKQASLSEQEVKFLAKVHEVIEQHFGDDQFSIDAMSREIGVSYSKLYAKVKALTGQTPQEFISTYRMNKAMELLKSGNYNVSEVADMVGSSSPFNFSRDFKKHFGVTPSSVFRK